MEILPRFNDWHVESDKTTNFYHISYWKNYSANSTQAHEPDRLYTSSLNSKKNYASTSMTYTLYRRYNI